MTSHGFIQYPAQLNESFLIILCLNCGVYDNISPKEFIDFFLLKVIGNFNILKINVKFEHHFIAPF